MREHVLLRLRIWLADRPGALGQLTREIGASGADIVQVSVLSRERGRALDEITVFVPEEDRRAGLERSLRALNNATVEGIRPSGEVPGAFPDLDLLGRVAADPRATLAILADALPRILAADWAVVIRAGVPAPLAASWDAPREPVLPNLPARAATMSVGTSRYACAPLGPDREAQQPVLVVVCRIGDPPFHRFEVLRLTRIAEVAAAIAGSRLLPRGEPAARGAAPRDQAAPSAS